MRQLWGGVLVLLLAAPVGAAPPVKVVTDQGSLTDVGEDKGKYYFFVGARYRGTIVPQAFMNIFVDGGRTVYNNSAAIEVDIRKDNFSIIPAFMFAEHGLSDTLFLDKGKDPADTGNWSVTASNVKGIYATVDLLWSVKLQRMLDFEIGGGAGFGILFGDLSVNWVTDKPTASGLPGPYMANGRAFYACKTETDDTPHPTGPGGCSRADHRNADVAKVYASDGNLSNPYAMKYWADGGPVPNVFFHLSVPQIGLRFKPIKSVVARITTGFSIIGFFFGFSLYYGFERPKK